jgi:hypothetical protein
MQVMRVCDRPGRTATDLEDLANKRFLTKGYKSIQKVREKHKA